MAAPGSPEALSGNKKAGPRGIPRKAGSLHHRLSTIDRLAYAVRIVSALSPPLMAACAAARRAMGTRYGEQDT